MSTVWFASLTHDQYVYFESMIKARLKHQYAKLIIVDDKDQPPSLLTPEVLESMKM